MSVGDRAPTLLTEQLAARLGLDRVAAALGYPEGGAYLFPWLAALIDFGLLSGISWVVVGRETYGSPILLAIPIGLSAAIFLARWLRRRYRDAVDSLAGERFDGSLLTLPTGRLRLGLFVAFYVGNQLQLLSNPAEAAGFVAIHGAAIAWTKYLFVSLFYFVIYADVAALLAAAMLLFPWRIYRARPELDFSDVHGFAGLYETSRLLQSGAVVYFLGVAAWTAFLYAPQSAETIPEISPLERLLFPLLWAGGVVLYLGPVMLLHRYLVSQKEAKIEEIDAQLRELDPDGERKGIPYLSPRREDIPLVQQKYLELQQVRSQRDYPANVSIVEELALAALVPIVFQWGLSALFGI